MMISSFYIILNYFSSLLLFFNFNNPILFWILMEFNLISFILLMYMYKSSEIKQDSINHVIFYFLIQSSASILFLSNFSLGEWSSIFNYDVMFIVSLIFKIGLFPIFFWIFSLSEMLTIIPLIFLLSLQKIPLFCGLFMSNSSISFFMLFLSFVFGSLMLFFSNNLLSMFLCSSISYSFMLFFLYTLDINFFLLFFFFYSMFLFICLFGYLKNSMMKGYLNILILSYIFFIGLPPLGLFFFKFIFSGLIYSLLGSMELILFWGFSFLALMGYLKFFYNSFFFYKTFYLENVYKFKSLLSFFFIAFFFFLFLF